MAALNLGTEPDATGPFRVRDAPASSCLERLGLRADPERIFAELFAAEPYAFWLDAGIQSGSGTSYLEAASSTRPSYLVRSGELRLLGSGESGPCDGTIEDALRAALSPGRGTAECHPDERSPLGWVGWFGYEYGARRLEIDTDDSPYPDAVLLAADRVVAVDHATNEVSLWYPGDAEGRAWAATTRTRIEHVAASHATTASLGDLAVPRPGAVRWRHSDAEYLRMIRSCQDSIAAGDAYQLCLTNTGSVATSADPFTVYRRLRRISNATHGAYLRAGELSVLSASPELFLDVRDGVAVTRPVKGTRRRGSSPAEDDGLRSELGADEKERAENLMIVDLMRNDLGRVARVGGVSVTELLAVETHATVHQLVSTVRAELGAGTDVLDVLAACFPAGSMTGAPKLSAMALLHTLERGPRGVYSGCLGRIGLDGSAELAMVIRSIVMSGDQATIGSGGGITALSVPSSELAEVELKARALLEALGA